MTTALDPTKNVDSLRAELAGSVFEPTDSDWDTARAAWNLAVDQHPALVVIPADAADVARAVRFARSSGLRVAVQGTGHNASAYGDSLTGQMLIKTERMREIRIDPERRTARVGAGVTWGEVVGPAAEHGLAALAGSSHDVGVVGYSLGGGVSWLARKHGLAAERIVAIEMVSAHGDLREVTELTDPDAFWAMRGGGGSFGVVTALEFELLPITEVYAGALFFPYERSAEVLEAWREWTTKVPDEVTSVGRMLQFPPLPDVPEPLRGQSFVVVEASILATADRGEELMSPLRELGPVMDTFAVQPLTDLLELHMDPPGPVPGLGDHQMLADLDADSLARLVEAVGPGTDSPLLSFEFRHLGGALGRRAEGSGALGSLNGKYMTFTVGVLADPALADPMRAAFARAREALSSVDEGSRYASFSEAPTDAESIFGPRTLTRLREIRKNVDPDRVLLANHPVER